MKITIHRSGWLLIAVLIAFSFRNLGLMRGVIAGLLIAVSLLIHEIAHTLAARMFGVRVHGIGLKLVGAYTHRKYASKPLHDVVIAAAGPLSNLMLTFGLFFIPEIGIRLAAWLAVWNFGIALFNLIPLPGTDGYRILATIFWPDVAIYNTAK